MARPAVEKPAKPPPPHDNSERAAPNFVKIAESAHPHDLAEMIVIMIRRNPRPAEVLELVVREMGG